MLVRTEDNVYSYNYSKREIIYLHPKLISQLGVKDYSVREKSYFQKKIEFLRKNDLLEKDLNNVDFLNSLDERSIQKNIANLRNVCFELTEECNLQCDYCGCRDLYENNETRKQKRIDWDIIKNTIDYFIPLWKSNLNISYLNEITIAFYGGEPLLRFELIKRTVDYIKDKKINKNIVFQITTNGLLLNKYHKYLSKYKFRIIVSLDGDEHNNIYRKTLKGANSFNIVMNNILRIKKLYPEYFDRMVGFNSVLNNTSNKKEIMQFFENNVGSVNSHAYFGIRKSGIKKNRLVDYEKMRYKEKVEITKEEFQSWFISLTNLKFNDYSNFFEKIDFNRLSKPTSMCDPFDRKMFIDVNGNILPCEKVGNTHKFGKVTKKE